MKKLLMTLGVMAMSLTVAQAQYDDIYYNPKNDNSATRTTQQKKQKKSNYIADFSNMDVDAYNRAGDTYYATPVDTIGTRVGEDQDFVYTQQIQKYYNPTIVIDNADLLDDVLNNSYGNVEVVINNNGIPVFSPYYSSIYYDYPFYSNRFWGPSWSWSWNWGPSWAWGPSWSWGWNWGPSWAWGPSWNWGWGPSWGWGPGWGGGWNRPFYADYRPGAHRPVAPRPGWSHNRPGSNYNGGHYAGRPGGNRAPSSNGIASGTIHNRQYSGNRRGYNDGNAATMGNIRNNNAVTNRTYQLQSNRRQTTTTSGMGTTTPSSPNRRYGTQTQRATTTQQSTSTSSFNRNNYGGSNRNTGNNRSYNTNRNTNTYNRSTYNNGSYNSSRSSGGSYGGGSYGGNRGGGGSRAGGGHRR